MRQPLVSIIVNVYNGERYIAQCVEAILSLDGGFPLQVIVVDDASQDSTAEILRRYDDSRLELLRLERNVGAAAAITRAFDLVRGELVGRIDYDDRYHPSYLVDSVAALERYPEAAFVSGRAIMIDSTGAASFAVGPGDYGEEPGCRDRFLPMLTRHFVTAPTILGRASHWRRAIPIPEGMNFCDWYMNLTMAESAPVAVLDKVTADYRIHALNMHTTKVRDGMGERVTFEVLDRFLYNSPRRAELAPHVGRIMGLHYADWGDKYFAAEMDADCLRCYRVALRYDPSLAWRGRFLHRFTGITAGRRTYERIKRLARGFRAVAAEAEGRRR